MTLEESYWRLCSSCKKPLPFDQTYYVCSVSTCNRKRTYLTFCSISCWQAHLPILRHRDAWAEERRSPTRDQFEREKTEEVSIGKLLPETKTEALSPITPPPHPPQPEPVEIELNEKDLPEDILIVTSKLKKYIRARSGLNTSESVLQVLSDIVRRATDEAIQKAVQDGRKTVMGRDY